MTERIWLKSYPEGVPHDIDTANYTSVAQLMEEVLQRFEFRPAYYCMGKTLSFGDINEKSKAFAAYLQHLGMKPGDKLALMMPNILQYPICLFGALRAGLTVVNTNPLYTPREMEHQFNDAGVTAIVIAENFAHNLEKIIGKTEIKHVITASIGEMLGGFKGKLVDFVIRKVRKMVPKFSLPGSIKFSKVLRRGAGMTFTAHKTEMDDMISIQYTGGTTGVAKGAMLTNSNLLHNMSQVRAWIENAGLEEGKEVMLTPLPLYHIFSFTIGCLCMSSFGALNVLIPNPRDIPGLVKEIKKTNPSLMTGVNTLFNALLSNEDFCALNFSGLKVAVGGATAIRKDVANRWKNLTGIDLTEGYGMTEASPCVSVNPLNGKARIGTIGLPIPSTEVRIANHETNEEVALGERGEIQVRGPQVMKGYYNRPEATANTITKEGWLKTGDVGILSEDGFITIVDRIKDMILVSGFNVYPNEVEDVIALHPKVSEVAAIGVDDEKSGEALKIFVVKADASLKEEELRTYCTENFTGYKKPKYIEFREELPKSPVGKILRRHLREE